MKWEAHKALTLYIEVQWLLQGRAFVWLVWIGCCTSCFVHGLLFFSRKKKDYLALDIWQKFSWKGTSESVTSGKTIDTVSCPW